MIERRSAGAVVFNELLSDRYFLLLLYGAGHWDFPKGGIEEGEGEVDAVRREVWEETGIDDLSIIDGFRRVIQYFYRSGDRKVRKTVIFYLAKTNKLDVRLSFEHKAYAWLKRQDALQQLTYLTAKRVLEDADDYLRKIGMQSRLRSNTPDRE